SRSVPRLIPRSFARRTSARCMPGVNVPITIASRSATSAWARRLLTWRDGRAVAVEAIYALKRESADLATVDSQTVGPVLSSTASAPQPSVADSGVPRGVRVAHSSPRDLLDHQLAPPPARSGVVPDQRPRVRGDRSGCPARGVRPRPL